MSIDSLYYHVIGICNISPLAADSKNVQSGIMLGLDLAST